MQATTFKIEGNLTSDDLQTEEDCVNALAILNTTIVKIESDVSAADLARQAGEPWDRQWVRKARAALGYKRAARVQVLAKQAEFRRARKHAAMQRREKVLLDIVKEIEPDVLTRAVDLAYMRFPEVFGAVE